MPEFEEKIRLIWPSLYYTGVAKTFGKVDRQLVVVRPASVDHQLSRYKLYFSKSVHRAVIFLWPIDFLLALFHCHKECTRRHHNVTL